ncbi:hypothetical protein GCM10025751_48110 [Haladaptatus pallidirubidus]|uniref:Uncharacterized protein n=1 Tax=Haladaptatus pallidirubidus TaxID=1008152 RepID=A0AAV3UNS6_9EURY
MEIVQDLLPNIQTIQIVTTAVDTVVPLIVLDESFQSKLTDTVMNRSVRDDIRVDKIYNELVPFVDIRPFAWCFAFCLGLE